MSEEFTKPTPSPFVAALIVFGAILIIGAIFAYNYVEKVSIPFLGTIEKYPYRDYAFPLGIIGLASFFAGLIEGKIRGMF